MGYLPAGLRNYLARLGWSHGDDEIFSTEQMIEWFDIDDINKSPGRLDFAKLADVNGHYIRQASDAELMRRIREFLPEAEGGPELVGQAGQRRLGQAGGGPAVAEGAGQDPEGAGRRRRLPVCRTGLLRWTKRRPRLLDAEARAALARLLPQLEAVADWQVPALEAAVRGFGEASGQKLGKVAQPLRAALTGEAVSPPVFDVMAVLGREEALARIRDQAR